MCTHLREKDRVPSVVQSLACSAGKYRLDKPSGIKFNIPTFLFFCDEFLGITANNAYFVFKSFVLQSDSEVLSVHGMMSW